LFSLLAIAVGTGSLLVFDETIRLEIHSWASPALTPVMRGVSLLGSVAVIVALSLASAVALAIMHRTRDAIVLVCTMAGVMLLNSGLKLFFHQARPIPYFGDVLDTYSFPSGHSAYSCCFYFAIAAIVATGAPRPSIRALPFGIATVIVAAVGFSRVYLGVHQPSDVLGGYLVAMFVLAIAKAANQTSLLHGENKGSP